ncbi:Uncharacterised protein [Mycobacterium tuberculosis]|nr:Uncharacterised protein [Mycobacterium tuberculosis]
MVKRGVFGDFAESGKQEIAEAHPLRRCPRLKFLDELIRHIPNLNH